MGWSTGPMSKPRSSSGRSLRPLRTRSSVQARSLARPRILGSLCKPCVSMIASLTCAATRRLRSGSMSSANGGARLSRGKHSNAIVRSRSSRKAGFPGARGAKWVVANSRAGKMSPSGLVVHLRINSMSCKRKREKCNEESVSNI